MASADADERFWLQLLERAREKGLSEDYCAVPGRTNWIVLSTPIPDFQFRYGKLRDHVVVELFGRSADPVPLRSRGFRLWNAVIEPHRAELGHELKRGLSRNNFWISVHIRCKGYRAEEDSSWPAVQDAMLEAMECLRKLVLPRMREIASED